MEQLLSKSQIITRQHQTNNKSTNVVSEDASLTNLNKSNNVKHQIEKTFDENKNIVDNDHHGLNDDHNDDDDNNSIKFKDWGLKVDRLFEVAYRFYKRNESKAFHPTFDTRNQMNALILQARYGNFDGVKAPDVGALDLVGKSRRHQWSLLKGMSKTEAMSKFILTLDEICPFFKAHAEAVKISLSNNTNRMSTNRSEQNQWPSSGSTSTTISSKNSISNYDLDDHNIITDQDSDDQLKAIRTSLNRQTYDQFKSYAEKQYPDDIPKKKYLIATLQEQYYQQYISQMHPEISNNNKIESAELTTKIVDNSKDQPQINSSKSNQNSDSPTQQTNSILLTSSTENNRNLEGNNTIKNLDMKTSNNDTNQLQSNESSCNNSKISNVSIGPSLGNNDDFHNEKVNNNTSLTDNSDRQKKLQYNKVSELSRETPTYNDISMGAVNHQTQVYQHQYQQIDSKGVNLNLTINGSQHSVSQSNMEKSNIDNNHNQPLKDKILPHPNTMYSNAVSPQEIGQFESYPAPKPIQNTVSQQQSSLLSVAINMFNTVKSNSNSNQKQQQLEAQNTNASPNNVIVAETPQIERQQKLNNAIIDVISGGNNFFKPITPPNSSDQPLEELPIPFQPLPSPPLQMLEQQQQREIFNSTEQQVEQPYSADYKESPIMDQDINLLYNQNINHGENNLITDTLNTNQTREEQQQPVNQRPPVDSWSCGSSDGRGSPLQQNAITYEPLEPASIWTKKGVVEFRESLIDDKHGGMHVVNQQGLLTIEVPTYSDGRYIHWEFCTEDFDIAFGLDFVYNSYPPESTSLRIYEETDTDEEEEEEEEIEIANAATEGNFDYNSNFELAGDRLNRITRRELLARKRALKSVRLANTISIVPTYRRDSHEEVFVGRHKYPGQGYYLLKFDNTYSVLRSKSLYFRICYLM